MKIIMRFFNVVKLHLCPFNYKNDILLYIFSYGDT